MKKIAITVLIKLIKKYAPEVIAYLGTKLLQYEVNKHGVSSYKKVIKEAGDINNALDTLVKISKDGVITKQEVKDFTPVLIEAIKM